MTAYPDLTPDQSEALEAFAAEHRTARDGWRVKLGDAWRNASLSGPIHQVRNTHGPTWLFDVYGRGWRASLPAWVLMIEGATWAAGEPARWSGKGEPPKVGARVRVSVNGLGAAVVTGYYVEDGYLGVLVRFEAPPERFVKQWGGNLPCHVFGAELEAAQ